MASPPAEWGELWRWQKVLNVPGRVLSLGRDKDGELYVLTNDELGLVYHQVITMGEHRKSVGDNDLKRMIERVRGSAAAAAAATRSATIG